MVDWLNFEMIIKIIFFLIIINLVLTILTLFLLKIQKCLKAVKKRIKSKLIFNIYCRI